MASRLSFAREDREFKILHLLEKNSNLTQREIAAQLGVSLGALNYCLRSLAEKGLIKIKNFSESNNKFGYAYLLTPRGMHEKARLTRRFFHRKLAEYVELRREIEELSSSLAEGQRLEKERFVD